MKAGREGGATLSDGPEAEVYEVANWTRHHRAKQSEEPNGVVTGASTLHQRYAMDYLAQFLAALATTVTACVRLCRSHRGAAVGHSVLFSGLTFRRRRRSDLW